MKILSLNVGTPKEMTWQGKLITTSIFKSPVTNSCKVSFTNIEGDLQSDLKNHGGINKAVYSYDIQYYEHWKSVLKRSTWEMGLFGENLTTEGILDNEVKIGNIYQIGTAWIQAVQPRFPCFKLNARFGMKDMIERFFEQKRFGTYFKVSKEGFISSGDTIELIKESRFNVTISDITEARITKGKDQQKLKEILELPCFPEKSKEVFRGYLK